MKYIKLTLIIVTCFFIACGNSTEKAVQYLNDGLTKVIKSDNKGAIEDFTKVIKIQPDNSEAYFHRACCYFNLKDTTKSMADFNKAIELNPGYADAFYNRALLKHYINDLEGACSDWKKAIKLGKVNIKDSFNFCKE